MIIHAIELKVFKDAVGRSRELASTAFVASDHKRWKLPHMAVTIARSRICPEDSTRKSAREKSA